MMKQCIFARTVLCATALVSLPRPTQSVTQKNSVTIFFNEEKEQTRTVVFEKPVLDIRDGPPRQIVGYICSGNTFDGYQLIQVNPACLYLSYKNTNNFKLLASKMCVNHSNLIVAKKST